MEIKKFDELNKDEQLNEDHSISNINHFITDLFRIHSRNQAEGKSTFVEIMEITPGQSPVNNAIMKYKIKP